MKQSVKRLTSLLLVLALVLSFSLVGIPQARAADYWWLPYVEAPEDYQAPGVQDGVVTAEGDYILMTSDLHRYTYLAKDLLTAANDIVAAEDGGAVGLFAFGGDFANEKVLYADNMTILKHAIVDTSPTTVANYTKGNHEGKTSDEDFLALTGMSRIGETAKSADEDYYFFNFGASSDSQKFLDEDIAQLREFLASHNDGKPIFIVSHFPLHYYNDRRSTKKADEMVELLNQYPQVIFGWGHNHTESDPAYGTIRTPGDTIMTGVSEDTTREINFIYMSLGALRDGTNDANGVLIQVEDGGVLFRYIDLGVHNDPDGGTWVDAQGNENTVKLAGEPVVSATLEDNDLTVDGLKTIHKAFILLDRPLVDNAPDTEASEFSDRFDAGTVTWTTGGEPFEGTFDFDTAYTATVELKANEGYTFADDAKGLANFKYVGPMGEEYPVAANCSVIDLTEDTMTLEITYDNTVKPVETPIDMATSIEDGSRYVLAATDAKYAAYYRYNRADHGEESRPEYKVSPSDVVIRDGQLVSEVSPFVQFTAAKDDNGYLLYSDASLLDEDETVNGAEALNYLSLSIRGCGEMNLEASESAGLPVYNNWNIDENGLPYLDVDGAFVYAGFANGEFCCVQDPNECNVRLFKVGDANEEVAYNVLGQIAAPEAGYAPAAEATVTGGTVTSVTWEPADETFQPGVTYTVTIQADMGKPISVVAAARVNGADAECTAEGNTATLTATFSIPLPGIPVDGVKGVKADALGNGLYVIVADGKAMTSGFVDGLYLAAADVAVSEDGAGAEITGITGDMIFALDGNDEDGYSILGSEGYLAGKSVGGSPDCWGFALKDKPAMTLTYADGKLVVKSTGAGGGPGGPGGGPGGPPPGAKDNTIYMNNNHFNFCPLQASEVTIYKLASGFEDVAGHWAEDYILAATLDGIFKGVSATKFAPGEHMSRAMAVSTLYRMAGSPEVEPTDAFSDVAADKWYAPAVAWAVANGITDGVGGGRFAPGDDVSRQQFALFLSRFAAAMGVEMKGDLEVSFTDQDEIASWAAEAVNACAKAGIVSGRTDGRFDPKAGINRAEAAKMLEVFLDMALTEDAGGEPDPGTDNPPPPPEG